MRTFSCCDFGKEVRLGEGGDVTGAKSNSCFCGRVLKEEDQAPVEKENRPLWRGNWNAYLLAFGPLGAAFTVVRGRAVLDRGFLVGPWLWEHVLAGGICTWACIWNLFHTPGHGPAYSRAHVWVGRLALASCLLAVAGGMAWGWFDEAISRILMHSPDKRKRMIRLTVLGSVQGSAALAGWFFVRVKRVLWAHSLCMCVVFYCGCGIPALLRVHALRGGSLSDYPNWEEYSWTLGVGAALLAWQAMRRQSLF